MTSSSSFFFHDYETFGTHPNADMPAQFAGQRTDLDFNPIGDPINVFCRPNRDRLPHPEACLLTGITPQQCEREGVAERDFFAQVHEQLAAPGTIGLGYNSIRFDDEVTRFGLYRHFFDPYGREWQHGCSRWDLIDLTRACYALRPEGMKWPLRDDGTASFKLEDLARVNALTHTNAHDAGSDVQASIALAKMIKSVQPKLFDYFFNNRSKHAARAALKLGSFTPLLHVSSRFPASRGCLAVILPLTESIDTSNKIIVADLSQDPSAWLDLDVDDIRDRIFVAREDLPEGIERVALKHVHLNRAPILAPLNTLSSRRAVELGIDLKQCMRHAEILREDSVAVEKVRAVFATEYDAQNNVDADLALYSGGLPDPATAKLFALIRSGNNALLRDFSSKLKDSRYRDLLFRYRARYFADDFSRGEKDQWDQVRRDWLNGAVNHPSLDLMGFSGAMRSCREANLENANAQIILDQVEAWGRDLAHELTLVYPAP